MYEKHRASSKKNLLVRLLSLLLHSHTRHSLSVRTLKLDVIKRSCTFFVFAVDIYLLSCLKKTLYRLGVDPLQKHFQVLQGRLTLFETVFSHKLVRRHYDGFLRAWLGTEKKERLEK